jgi:PEP-CTERM motif
VRHAAAFALALMLAAQASAMGNFQNFPSSPSGDRDPRHPTVPEPAAILVFAAGGAIIGWSLYRRR